MYSDDIDNDEDITERLIQAVQSKPALYNKSLKEYSDRNIVSRCWTEVFEKLVDSWNNFSPLEQALKGKEIQQRWRNIRTCFKRELNKQQIKGKSGTKRRKYIHFDQLSFLLKPNQDTDAVAESEINPPQIKTEVTVSEVVYLDETLPPSTPPRSQEEEPLYEESFSNNVREEKIDEFDEDKLFLLSLVPSFKRMSDDQKIEAKIEFLSAIRRISRGKTALSKS